MKSEQNIRLGTIGCGFVAQIAHLPCFDAIDNISIVAISDPRPDVLKNVANKYSVDSCFKSHVELLEGAELDAVVVVLPRYLTANVVRECLKRRVSVLSEKPLMLNYHTGLELLALCDNQVNVQVGYMKRHDSGVQLFKNICSEYLKKEELIHVQVSSSMGDSYCAPLGVISSEFDRMMVGSKEALPEKISDDFAWAYEQFLNVFSHMLDLVEFIHEENLVLTFADLSKIGTGQVCARLGTNDFPVSFRMLRGKQMDWREFVEYTFESTVVRLKLPPPFLRNIPSEVTIEEGIHTTETRTIRPEYSWAFLKQAQAFCSFVHRDDKQDTDILSAMRHAKLVEELFSDHFFRGNVNEVSHFRG